MRKLGKLPKAIVEIRPPSRYLLTYTACLSFLPVECFPISATRRAFEAIGLILRFPLVPNRGIALAAEPELFVRADF